jgi:DNA-binding CsgD family transcriptional regulator
MSLHEHTLDVIQSFYDAALDERLWRGALEGLCDVTGSQAASFWVLDGSDEPRLPTFICINFDTGSIKEYLAHTAAIDPTVQYLVDHPREPIVHDALVISEREKDKHPYYDWHSRNVETRFRMVGQVRMASRAQAGVALHRTPKAGRYEPRDISRFSVLHRHLEKALAIGFRLSTLGAMQQAASERFDHSSAAVFFLDEHKRIVFSNCAAQEMISANDGIRLRDDGLVLARKQDDNKFQGLVSQAISPIVSTDAAHGGAMRVLRPSGKRPYGALVSSISGNYPLLSALRPAVCVTITDPDRKKPLPNSRLQAAFGLTAAEARLASRLSVGEDLRSAAGNLEITYGTARSRLAQIFQKTGTRRQGELIRLLLATLAAD